MSVERIAANLEAHFLTSGTFLLAALLTLPGLALLTVALRGTRGHVLSVMGFLGFFFASVLWTIHLAFRLTVLVWAVDQPSAADGGPAWLAPWVDWAGLLFGLYSVLAFLSIAAYGGALPQSGNEELPGLKDRRHPRIVVRPLANRQLSPLR